LKRERCDGKSFPNCSCQNTKDQIFATHQDILDQLQQKQCPNVKNRNKKLLEKEFSVQEALQLLKIELLERKITEQIDLLQQLTQRADAAADQAQTIAIERLRLLLSDLPFL